MRNKMNKVPSIQEANGFTALNCEDGYRKDNRLWFGECSECGERITNSALDGVWKHTTYSLKGYFSKETFERNGMPNHTSSKDVDFCPKVAGVKFDCVVYYYENDEKVYA